MKARTKLKQLQLILIPLLLLTSTCFAQARLFCSRVSGQPLAHQGDGACDGTVTQSIYLKSVGLTLNYSGRFNVASAEIDSKNWMIDGASAVWTGKNPYIKFGNGFYGYLEPGVGQLKGALVLKGRLVADYFTTPDANTVWQYTIMTDPTESLDSANIIKYRKTGDNRFVIQYSMNRRNNQRTTYNVGPGSVGAEYIQLPNGEKIVITRSANKRIITFTRGKNVAILENDSNYFLVKITDKTSDATDIYKFKYKPGTNLMSEFDGPEGNSKYTYDSNERLTYESTKEASNAAGQYFSRKTLRYIYNGRGFVEVYDADGSVSQQIFDDQGYLVETHSWYANSKNKRFNEQYFNYSNLPNCTAGVDYCRRLESILTPNFKQVFNYSTTDPSLSLGYKTYSVGSDWKLGALAGEVADLRDIVYRRQASYVEKDGTGKILNKTNTVWFWDTIGLPKRIWNAVPQNEVLDYEYDPEKLLTTKHYTDRNSFRYRTEIYTNDQLTSNTLYASPSPYKTTTYAYDAKKRLVKRTLNGKSETWLYDSLDRMSQHVDSIGTKTLMEYGADNVLRKQTTTYITGLVRTEAYSKVKYASGKTQKFTITTVLPTGKTDVHIMNYSEGGDLVSEVINGKSFLVG